MNLKLIITDALQFFRDHIVQIAALCLPWLLAIALVQYLVIIIGDPSQQVSPLALIGMGFQLLVYPIYTGALILLMAKRARRETPTNKELTSSALKLWQPLFILRIITAGILVPGVIFAVQGWFLFIIPVIYVFVRLCFAEFYLVLEGVKPLEAIRLSFRATQPCFFQLLFLLTIFGFPLFSLQVIAASVLAQLKIDPLVNILAATLTAFLSFFVDVLLFRAYMSARQAQP
jgi:hypothetical protein